MPHIHLKENRAVSFPAQFADTRFEFIATNVKHTEEQLIAVEVENKKFFILLKDAQKRLAKSDKITRPSPTFLMHKALLDYVALSDADVFSSNVHTSEKNIHFQNDLKLKPIEFFTQNFPDDKELHIEVGFGSGRHLIHQALAHPEILFIGIEIHRPSIEQVLKQISIKKIENLLLLDYDARLFMELVPSNIVGKIYVHFPVPWDKKPHRRVISKAFINEAIRVLKVEGRLELRTDSDNYFNYAYETFISLQQLSLEIHKNRAIAVTSKYEDRWRRMEKNIYDVTMINTESSAPKEHNLDFSFPPIAYNTELFYQLNTKTLTFDEGFIHFERLYKIQDGGMMFRLSLGSFQRPEHVYLIINEETLSYFPQHLIATRTNYYLHQQLCKALNG
jgi:tRNA (guanine-N7-)-methyltransferase